MSILNAGAAKIDITPPAGVDLAGYGQRVGGGFQARGVNDPIWVRALALESDGRCFVLLVYDLLGVRLETTRRIRSLICGRIPVIDQQIMVCATHNHSAPTMFVETAGYTVDASWSRQATEAAAEAAALAYRALQPTCMSFGSAEVAGVGANRQVWLDDGSIFHYIGRSARRLPEGRSVIREGFVDPALSVLGLQTLDGDWIAALINYACHPWLYNGSLISSEIPGACADYVEAQLSSPGRPMVTLYTDGAGSDITTLQHQMPMPEGIEEKERWFAAERLRFGAILGHAALRAIAGAGTHRRDAAVAAQVIPFACPIHERPLIEIRREDGALPPAPLTRDMEVQVVTVGEHVLVGLPCEVYVAWGLAIKQRSRFSSTMIISQANDYYADIVTHEAVTQGACPELTWTQVDPAAGDMILDLLRAPIFAAETNTEAAHGARCPDRRG